MSHGHILRSHYVVLICSNLIWAPDSYLNPGWNSVDSVLTPNKDIATIPEMYSYLWVKEKLYPKMSMQQVWCFVHRILQVQQSRMLHLSLPINSVEHCIRYTNIKVLCEPNFPAYGQNPRTYTGKYISEKTCILACFTQCDVFHLLAQKLTYH